MGYEKSGKYLKDTRTRAGITQRELGELLGGTHNQMISNVERGMCYLPVTKDLAKLSKVMPEFSALKYIDFVVEEKAQEFKSKLTRQLKKK